MVANLKPLIRFRRHGVDEKRRILSQLFREQEKVIAQKEVIEQQMDNEIELAKEMGTADAQAYLGKYLEGARKKVYALESTIKKMDVRIAAAQEDIRAAFAEVKKVEITQANREAKEAAEQKRKEDASFDEIALEQFRRQEDDAK